jgi:uncharacterized protein YndB with AHSA1/START domain
MQRARLALLSALVGCASPNPSPRTETMTDSPATKPTRDIVLTRTIDAPLEQVWTAWTDCEQVKRWWGPTGFTSPACTIDLREGGRYVFTMRAPQEMGGVDFHVSGVYKRIVPMELLEFGQGLSDQDGNPIDPGTVGMPPDFPREIRTVVTFKRMSDGRTELTATEYDWAVGQMADVSEAGFAQTLDKLVQSFAAPRAHNE